MLPNPGFTVVVTPLISLMQDRVSALLSKGIQATQYHSDVASEDRAAVLQALRDVSVPYKLVHTTPEQLQGDTTFFTTLVCACENASLQRIVFDEAHCVAQWGNSFRCIILPVKMVDIPNSASPHQLVQARCASCVLSLIHI